MDKSGDRRQISRVGEIVRAGLVSLLSVVAVGCGTAGPHRACSVDQLSVYSVTTLEGPQHLHQDWVNRYIDVMRFALVDRNVIVDNAEHEPIKIISGSHETAVYFCREMGSARGLAAALVAYAAARESMSRTLRFEPSAGEVFRAMAEPKFSFFRQDVTTLSHVNLWVEDLNGSASVSSAS